MPSTQYIDERSNTLFIFNRDGDIDTVNKTPYNVLKYKEYHGNRIFYDFDENHKIAETYDDRIFNCTLNKATMQIRMGKSNELAQCILDEKEKKGGGLKKYQELFKKQYYDKNRDELIDNMVGVLGERVKKITGGYMIDDMFMVDMHGTSHIIQRDGKSYVFGS
jgi:hypothetical protein